VCSSAEETGEDRAGEGVTISSASETWALSSDAAKLLEISGSDTKAKEDWVDVVDMVEVVRSRAERRELRGSSCHAEFATSTWL